MKRLVLGLTLVAALTMGAEGCELGADELRRLIQTHEITVRNESGRSVVTTVVTQDVKRSQVLGPGESLLVTSLARGRYASGAVDAAPYLTPLRTRRDALVKQLQDPGLSRAAREGVWSELRRIRRELETVAERSAAYGGCSGPLEPGPDGTGAAVSVVIVYTAAALQLDARCG
jgi:hypothetical protein